ISLRDVRQITSHEAHQIAAKALAMFEAGEVDVISIAYAQFKNVITQTPTVQTLVPAIQSIDPDAPPPDLQGAAYEYELEEEEVLAVLQPRYLTTPISNALLQNAAGEQGARMSAMDNATRIAGEMIDRLT